MVYYVEIFSYRQNMQIRIVWLFLGLSLLLTHCVSYDLSRRIVQQGNLLPQARIEHLKIGMSKENAAIVLGTSLLSPLFNTDRWDYAYTYREGVGPLMVRNVSLYFSHDKLVRIERCLP